MSRVNQALDERPLPFLGDPPDYWSEAPPVYEGGLSPPPPSVDSWTYAEIPLAVTPFSINATNRTAATIPRPWTAAQESAMLYTYLVLVVLITVSIMVANILVLVAMYKYRTLRTVTNRFVVSLSVADLLVGVFFILSLCISMNQELTMDYTMCCVKAILPQTAFMVSLFNLMGIAIDRYIAVMYPLHYPSMMRGRRVNALIIGMWVYALCLVAIPIPISNNWLNKVAWTAPALDTADANATGNWTSAATASQANETLAPGMPPPITAASACYVEFFLNKYHLSVVFLHYWLGAIIMTFVYGCIFNTTAQHIRRLERQSSNYVDVNGQNGHTSQKAPPGMSVPHLSQTVRVFGLVFGSFFCLLTPYYTLYMVVAFSYRPDNLDLYLSYIWLPLCDVLIAFNSTINPYIYAWKYTDFRLAFKAMLCCQSRQEYNRARSNSCFGHSTTCTSTVADTMEMS